MNIIYLLHFFYIYRLCVYVCVIFMNIRTSYLKLALKVCEGSLINKSSRKWTRLVVNAFDPTSLGVSIWTMLLIFGYKSPTKRFPSPINRQSRQIVLKLTTIYQMRKTILKNWLTIAALVGIVKETYSCYPAVVGKQQKKLHQLWMFRYTSECDV